MKKYLLSTTLAVLLSSTAYAQTDSSKLVDIVGVQGLNYYFSVSNGLTLNCLYQIIYFSNESGFGKGAYSTLLTAKAQNKPLNRISYSQDPSSNICTLDMVEFN